MPLREKIYDLWECFLVSVGFVAQVLLRPLLLVIGWCCVGLGFFGAIPGNPIPTVPLLLLALWCFKHSSPERYEWLLNSKYLGPPLRDWQDTRRISKETKMVALVTIMLSFSWSIYIVKPLYLRFFLFCVAVLVSWFILKQKSK